MVRKYADLPLGGVDASVIAVAERLGDIDVATTDRWSPGSRGSRPRTVLRATVEFWPRLNTCSAPVTSPSDRAVASAQGGARAAGVTYELDIGPRARSQIMALPAHAPVGLWYGLALRRSRYH